MEIVGIGTEIVECLRIGRMIEQHGELFLTRVFTDREIRFCQARKRALEHFAALWAAKEAVLKALGQPWRRGMELSDIEVQLAVDEPPRVHLGGATRELAEGLHLGDVLLSLSHCRAYATATAIAVRG
ncbi:MAG: holo-ACP synthase [Gemmataceae bacterium]